MRVFSNARGDVVSTGGATILKVTQGTPRGVVERMFDWNEIEKIVSMPSAPPAREEERKP